MHIKTIMFLLQVFLIITHQPLVRQLADIIFNGEIDGRQDVHESPQEVRTL